MGDRLGTPGGLRVLALVRSAEGYDFNVLPLNFTHLLLPPIRGSVWPSLKKI